MFMKFGFLLVLATMAMAYPSNSAHDEVFNADLEQFVPYEDLLEYQPLYLVRGRREIEFNPHIDKKDGTTNAGGSITHRGDNHEVTGHWNKNIHGPGRAKPNYGIRGSFKW